MIVRRCLMILGLLGFLAGCESTPTHLFTYGAQGVVIQAERLVGQFFDRAVDPLPYGGVNIDQPLARMHARFPILRQHLDSGKLGLTEDGDVAIREASTTPELKRLVRAENRDQAVLYTAMAGATGHGDGGQLQFWLPYVDATFASEWQKQASAGWWLRDEQNEWRRKP